MEKTLKREKAIARNQLLVAISLAGSNGFGATRDAYIELLRAVEAREVAYPAPTAEILHLTSQMMV